MCIRDRHNLKSTVWEASPKKDKVKDRSQPIAARSMLRAGHPYIGRRVARLFGRRLVLGTVTGFLPACKIQGVGALFRVTHDDGDEEDLEEHEARDAIALYEAEPGASAEMRERLGHESYENKLQKKGERLSTAQPACERVRGGISLEEPECLTTQTGAPGTSA